MAEDARLSPLLLLALLLLAAGGLLSSLGGQAYLPRLLLLSGAGTLLWGGIRSARAFRFLLFRARRVAEPGPAATWFLAGVLLLVTAVGLHLDPVRLDLTARKLQSLSSTSRRVLAGLQTEVELIGVYRDNAADRAEAKDVLAIYRMGSKRIRTRILDPEREPEEARRLGISIANGLVVRVGSATGQVDRLTEEDLTLAILRATDPNRPVVALLMGHGAEGEGGDGLGQLRQLLERNGLLLRPLRLVDLVEVPEDVRAVLVVGPSAPLFPGEVGALARFLDRGGRVAFFLEPETPSGCEDFLRRQGILVDGRRVWDDGPLNRSVGLGPEAIPVRTFGDHPTTRGLSAGVVLRGATRVALAPRPVFGVNGTAILRSAASARLRPRGDGAPGDSASSIPLGVALDWEVAAGAAKDSGAAATGPAAMPTKPSARIVVVGDSDFLQDEDIHLYGNRELVGRIIGWLSARDFLLKFPQVDRSGTPLRAGLTGLRTVFYLLEVLLPLAVLGLGAWIWVRRR